jgi:glyoxylase-like metal-dependent hydrolase (beta-lactamase superfamily II)
LADDLFTLSPAQLKTIRQRTKLQEPYDFSTNGYLINTGKKLILIDAGNGTTDGGEGRLVENLKAAGYAPDQVDDIYLTHMHYDHVGGISNGAQRVFPNATVHVDQRELPEWEQMAADKNQRAIEVVAKIQPYIKAKKYQAFQGATQFADGLRAIPTYGHTAGHSFFQIESKGQKMLFWCDFVLNEKIQLDQPNLEAPREGKAGVALRKKYYGEAAQQNYLVAASHIPFPGIGRVRRLEQTPLSSLSYIWVALDYALPIIPTQNTD